MVGKILEGIRVIDWGQFNQGPEAGALLADLGADVIHVEQLGIGDDHRGMSTILGVNTALPHGRHATFEYYNRNKRGIAINLKHPRSREVMHRLVKNADVFITNFMAVHVKKFGLDYATLSQVNPRLIYGSASIFGEVGPDSDMPGFDPSVTARSGMLMACGDSRVNGPAVVVLGMADQEGGSTLAFGILAALMARERYGIGQEVKTSALGSTIKLMSYNMALQLIAGSSIPRLNLDYLPPHTRFYPCKDDRWIQISCFRDKDWAPLCRAIGRPDIENDPDFDSFEKRMRNERLAHIIGAQFASKTREEWLEILRTASLPHSAVNSPADLESDPMVIANDYIIDYDHPVLGKIKFPGFPWSFSKTPAELTRPAPECGEHTEQVLVEMGGYGWDEIVDLKDQNVI